jgi:hypothetical protein
LTNVAGFRPIQPAARIGRRQALPPDAQGKRQRTGTCCRQQSEQDLQTLQDACLRVSHLLQTSCLALRRLQLDYQDQRLAREALESQLAYMQACLRRSLSSFDRSA